MKHIFRKRFGWVFALAVAVLLIIPIAAFAHVETDQADYSPSSVAKPHLACPLPLYNPTHYGIQPGQTVTCTITNAVLVGSPLTVDVFIQSSTLGNETVTGTVSGTAITFTYTGRGNGCDTTDVKYDDGSGHTKDVDFGFAFVDVNGVLIACGGTTPPQPPTISKDASGSYDFTYKWDIQKSVDEPTTVKQSGGSATFTYHVTVHHDGGTASNISLSGQITVNNPNSDPMTADVTDAVNDPNATCNVMGGSNATLAPGGNTFNYSCAYTDKPASNSETNTATVTWQTQDLSNGTLAGGNDSFPFNFTFSVNIVDDCVDVSDPADPSSPRHFCVGDPGDPSFSYSYDHTVTGTPGSCVTYDNTATFTTNTTGATDSASQSVKLCVGVDLTVSKTANPAFKRTFTWGIAKDVDKTLVEQVGGTATFNYTVKVTHDDGTDSDWKVTGKITVSNPNDWEDIVANVADTIDNGGNCTVTNGTNVTVPKSDSVTLDYSCTFGANPGSGTNTATASWDNAAYFTPNGSKDGTAPYAFGGPTTIVDGSVTVTDPNAPNPPLPATVSYTDPSPKTFTYSKTVNVPANNCVKYPNTATIVETGQSASQTVEVCGPAKTGALTMGFWQNKNGQGIITGGASTASVCNSSTWLRTYAPFQDLSATATCAQVATYVTNVIKAANASGASMNAMLKAQMLATALDVYFSDPALGGNKISAPAPIGGVTIDLTMICKNIATCSIYENVSSAFGGATSLTVSQILSYAASQSNAGGSVWYGQVKATQELAKDTFDAINNQVAFAP